MTYEEYLEMFSGKIPEKMFAAYTSKAKALLEKITDGRLMGAGKNADYAIAELAEAFFEADRRSDIIRETNDGYSVEYSSAPRPEAEAKRIARIRLPEEVLYAGVGKHDCGKH